MPAKIWLHIGSEKTGTSSIQLFLAKNRAALAKRGFIVPVAAGRGNHMGLAAYALGNRVVKVLSMYGVRSLAEVQPFHERLERELIAETATPADAQIIFSNEHCSSRLRSVAELTRLKHLCNVLAPQTTVVIYIRNQVDQLTSWYSTAIKGGSTKQLQWPPGPVGAHMLDYHALLQKWAEVFGHDNLVVRRFVSSDFVDGDVINDFSDAIGLDPSGLMRPPRVNSSLDVDCLTFLREFNHHLPRHTDGELNTVRGPIVALLEELSGSSKLVVSPEIAAEVTEFYKQSNAAVARDFLAGRHDPLFPPAKSVGETELRSEAASLVRIAAAIWSANRDEINKLEAQVKTTRQRMRHLRAKLKELQAV